MAESVITGGEGTIVVRKDWKRRLLNELLALFIALLILLVGGLVLLDTAPGHRFVVDRIANIETKSGLRFRIGRIDGSLFGSARLKNVQVSDQQGVFLTSPEIDLDWVPGAWFDNRLSIRSLTAETVTLVRAPRLRPSKTKGPLLPNFDIRIDRLHIERFELGPAVTGKPRVGTIDGKVDIHKGRALIDFNAAIRDGGDKMVVKLDAQPDRNIFDVEARVTAPADGLIPAMLGIRRSLALEISGDGNWQRWRGKAGLDLSGRQAARFSLAVDKGLYRLDGRADPAPFINGRLKRLTLGGVKVKGEGTLKDNIFDGQLRASTPSLRFASRGGLDLGQGAFRNTRVGIDLIRPQALFTNMSGQPLRLALTLDGAYADADFSYRLISKHLVFDKTGFTDLRAEGKGRWTNWPMRLPLRLTARSITGVGDLAAQILANPRITGFLEITPKMLRADKLKLVSAKVNGTISLIIDFVTGRFDVAVNGGMTRYLIPGIGLVDIETQLKVAPGPDGKALTTGKAKAFVRRLDNDFFASLTGGLPRIESDLRLGSDGVLHLSGLKLFSPKLTLAGSGRRNKDGTFHIEAKGRQAEYGPLTMTLDGNIERPHIALVLASPNKSLGLNNVHLSLDPTAAGFDYRANGGSLLGPFSSNGAILLPKGAPTIIRVDSLDAGGAHASGRLAIAPGGFVGRLVLAGGTLDGTLDFTPVGKAQKIEMHLRADGANFPTIAVRSGRIDGTVLLDGGHNSVDVTVDAQGVELAGLDLARLTASARLQDGSGKVRADFAGRRGTDFAFTAIADLSPDRLSVTGNGKVSGEKLVLREAAVLTREGDGWALSPTAISFAGGNATVSGRSGSRPEVHARLAAMPLQILDLFWPKLDLSGAASGTVDYAWKGNRAGRMDLRIRGLSRSGLVLASKPIDIGIAGAIEGNKAALRAIAASEGKTVGRAQARFAPMGNGPLLAELMASPMFAQVRYTGPADTLWRLSGVEIIDLSGPVAVGADFAGSLTNPRITGTMRAKDARLESAVTGMAITSLNAEARFSGPKLVITSLKGNAGKAGTIAGSGTVDLSGGQLGLDLKFDAANALLLDRDDISAQASGPITIRSSGKGGTISGNLKLDKGHFRLGRASAAADVPQLAVRDIGLDPDQVIETADLHPWRLDLDIKGSDLRVTGLGISSRWRTTLKVGGQADAPRFTGRADLVSGDYNFAGRNFKLEHGVIRFNGESPINPQLDIAAEATVQGINASVLVQGTGLHPEISFASTPALPQDELLSRILFGTSITNLSAAEALQLASAVAALQSGGGGLDPINSLRKAIGLDRLRVVPADVATGQGTAIAAGKYITRKLFVEVITDGKGYSATQVEYQITRWLSLLSTISTIGRESASVRFSKDY